MTQWILMASVISVTDARTEATGVQCLAAAALYGVGDFCH